MLDLESLTWNDVTFDVWSSNRVVGEEKKTAITTNVTDRHVVNSSLLSWLDVYHDHLLLRASLKGHDALASMSTWKYTMHRASE